MNAAERLDPPCESCIGTGIGWPGPESHCTSCGGSGVIRQGKRLVDEDRWAFNHFELDPGEDEDYPS